MRKIFFMLTFALNYSYAQDQELAIAKVHYLFKHINDTTQPDNFLRDEVVTYIGQDGSYYTSYSSNRASEQVNAMLKDPGFDGNLTVSRNTTAIKENYLLKPAEDLIHEIRKLVGDTYVLKLDFPEQDWSIEEDTREIGGYLCQKAITRFKGRDYIAWFTTELPFSYGPWKLHGLPGLILEAYDSKKEVVFAYNGFDKEIEGSPVPISIPENAHLVTLNEFKKQEDAFKANPQAYMNARMGSAGTQVSVNEGGTAIVRTVRTEGSSGGTVVTGSLSPGGAAGTIDPSKIRAINIKNDDNYKPSQNTNNPIELAP